MPTIVARSHKPRVSFSRGKGYFSNKSSWRSVKVAPSHSLNACTQLELPSRAPPSPLPRVTKGIEVLEGCYGRLLHTAVPAPWKWSYAPCQLCFVFPLWKLGSLASLQEVKQGREPRGNSSSSPRPDWLIKRPPLCIIIQREARKSLTFNPASAPSPIKPPS